MDGKKLENFLLSGELDTRTCKIPSIFDMNVDDPDTPSPLTVNECLGE